MGSRRESMCFGFDLLPLPMKKTMAITSSKNAMTLTMQEKNAVADPCDSLRYIQLPNTLEFEQATVDYSPYPLDGGNQQ